VGKQRDVGDNGSWPFAEELFEHGDPLFVAEIRRIDDADRLGKFATRWYADPRPAARQFLLDYLDQPLNAFRHEALVKRLLKLAEKAADDEVMGRFLVAFDRSVRRVQKQRRRYRWERVATRDAAVNLVRQWAAEGWDANYYEYQEWRPLNRRETVYNVHGMRIEESLRVPDSSTMPRDTAYVFRGRNPRTGERVRIEKTQDLQDRLRLFSVATRRYLRRRAWRYFRKLGKQHPERYVGAMAAALKRYRDDDVGTGLALIDNWGLTHVLFHHSPVLRSRPGGWTLAVGRGLSELGPAPIYEEQWKATPQVLFELMKDARCRPVRQWALFMIRRDHAAILQGLSPEELFGLLSHDDVEVARLAAELLRGLPDLAALGVGRLLALLESPGPEKLEILCELLAERLGPERVPFEEAVRLAGVRPLPAARLGFLWLQTKSPTTEADCRALLGLAEAQAEPLRPEMVRWAREALSASPHFRPEWVLELLDSRHAEVRAEGWAWLRADDRARDDVDIWRKLLESPYDDVRLLLVADLEDRVARGGRGAEDGGPLDPALLRFLWASVLLNVHRGGRVKPLVVRQLVRRLTRRPGEARELLPILAAALRSVRGPEWRAGLAGVVQMVERNRDLAPVVAETFPELKI
jgi:hypothetical protein